MFPGNVVNFWDLHKDRNPTLALSERIVMFWAAALVLSTNNWGSKDNHPQQSSSSNKNMVKQNPGKFSGHSQVIIHWSLHLFSTSPNVENLLRKKQCLVEYGKWQLEANNRSIKSCQQVDEIQVFENFTALLWALSMCQPVFSRWKHQAQQGPGNSRHL